MLKLYWSWRWDAIGCFGRTPSAADTAHRSFRIGTPVTATASGWPRRGGDAAQTTFEWRHSVKDNEGESVFWRRCQQQQQTYSVVGVVEAAEQQQLHHEEEKWCCQESTGIGCRLRRRRLQVVCATRTTTEQQFARLPLELMWFYSTRIDLQRTANEWLFRRPCRHLDGSK